MSSTPQTIRDFSAVLAARLRQTDRTASGAYFLDLRGGDFGRLGRVVLHDPEAPAWPDKGRTTKSSDEARRWVEASYAPYLYRKLQIGTGGEPVRDDTVTACCARYLADRARALGDDHNTVKNRRSQVQEHIVPTFGTLPMSALTAARVREWLNGLVVRRPGDDGKMVAGSAAIGTKRNLRTTLGAIWHHNFPDDPQPPFAGVRLDAGDGFRALREKIKAGDIEDLLTPRSGAMTPEKLRRALAAALWYDRTRLTARPNMRSIAVANTACIIALLVATGMRLEELLNLRWKMVCLDQRVIIVPGTKSQNALRAVPLQEQLLPWLERLRALEAQAWGAQIPPDAFVVRTNPRRLATAPAARKTVMSRVAEVLRWAGLKPPKKATHWARATHATWGSVRPDVLPKEALKAYLGHESPWGGATDDYVATLIEIMPPAHRHYIVHLPTPEEVECALNEFVPVERPTWVERGLRRRRRNEDAGAATAFGASD